MDIFGHWTQEAQEAQGAEGKHLMQLLPTPYSPLPIPHSLLPNTLLYSPFHKLPRKIKSNFGQNP
ncbi:Glycosyltransferase involved in cell wall bisynthesis [Nostoc flagelliforme CCNUN1]|uniref:Glycosyltransferase involved in cell wall bisynthesis n=1 Tax=Nostoc flagelliforme CCNUN1 TaxID=2038116 RepID=A0A2K8SKR2_9NOSO|nr:Glycosyltransferase involved in cell wall bisynthesis [Nostoc flagelliforme CCNUN1]